MAVNGQLIRPRILWDIFRFLKVNSLSWLVFIICFYPKQHGLEMFSSSWIVCQGSYFCYNILLLSVANRPELCRIIGDFDVSHQGQLQSCIPIAQILPAREKKKKKRPEQVAETAEAAQVSAMETGETVCMWVVRESVPCRIFNRGPLSLSSSNHFILKMQCKFKKKKKN